MRKLIRVSFKLLDVLVIFVMIFGSPMSALAQDPAPVLSVDKPDYAPGEVAHIMGTGFSDGNYVLSANGPDGMLNWGTVAAEGGGLVTNSPELVSAGAYEIVASTVNGESVASASFTVTAPPTATEAPTATEPPTAAPTDVPTEMATAEPTAVPTDTPTPSEPPTIVSDKADYAPGERVTLSGTNWQGDTTVSITVDDDLGKIWYYTDRASVQLDGTITDTFFLPTQFVAQYYVKATGTQTGRVANTSFTDSQEDYKHYGDKAPTGWQNGALQSTNSQYFEGEVVPHYWKTEGLVPGWVYGFNVYYDYYDPSSGGYCGFDYMAQYNMSRNPPPFGSSPSPVSSIPGGPGALYAVGAQIVGLNGPFNFGVQRFVQIRIQATSTKAEFYWGFHLAQPGAVSGCQGAKAWPGASLQTDVRNTPQFTQYMVGGGGSLQINPGAIIRGTISGFKWNDPNGNGIVDGPEPRLSGWTIRLCADPNCANVLQTATTDANGNYNFNVAPGTYFVREVQQSGWSQTYPGSIYYGATITATTPTYNNFNFGNRQGSSITIVKDAVPDDPQDFQFFGAFSSFLLDDDSDPALPNSRTFTNLNPGGYTVGEVVPDGWIPTNISCMGDNGNTYRINQTTVQIVLDPGESITCTFTNTKMGHIIVDKYTYPAGDPTSFNFDANGGTNPAYADFSLTEAAPPNDQTLQPGSYSVSEAIPSGWILDKSYCNSSIGDPESPGNIELDAGETVTCVFSNIKQAPALTLVKTATPSTYSEVGDIISYSYLVTNSGNVTLNGPVTVTDDKATVTCGVNPYVNPADVVLFDHFENSYLAQYVSGSPTYVNGPTGFGQGLDFTSGAWLRYDVPGWYQWTSAYNPVGKEGSIDLWVYPKKYNDVLVNFNWNSTTSIPPAGHILSLVIDSNGKLTSGQWSSITGPTLTPMSAGSATIPLNQWTHVAYTWGPSGSSLYVNGVQDAFSPDNLYPALNPTFYVYVPSWGNPGIGYIDEFRITNHTQSGFGGALAPGASTTCTADYTITQADLDSASVKNTAQAHANGIDSNTDDETVTATQSPALTLVKIATPNTYSAIGNVISYSYELTNTGNVTLVAPFTVTDDRATVTCPATPTSLAPGEKITCTASYTISQADLDAGSVTNTAQAHADGTESNTDTETVTADQTSALTLEKTATPATYSTVDDVISYSFVLTNSGNVTLVAPFTITDDKAVDEACPAAPTSLAPGTSINCTASYTITLADLDAGEVTNTAQGHGYFGPTPVDSNQDTATVTAQQSPALTLVKRASPSTYSAVGDTITYSYELNNSGNVTLSGPFTMTDDKATVTCPATTSLAPGDSLTCSATYTITQADLDSGSVTNTAQGHATFDGNSVDSNEDSETVTATQSPSLSLDKTASPATYDSVGDLISYGYLLTNSGNVTLSGPFTVTDNKATVTCPSAASLTPSASITCTASYTITQADLDAGSVTNTAKGKGSFNGNEVFSNEDSETVTAIQAPSLIVDKELTDNADEDGSATVSLDDTLTYTITATNNGNVTLHNVVVSDSLTGNSTNCPSVAPGNTCVLSVTYVVTQADVDAGNIHNVGTADSDETQPTEDPNDVPLPQNPSIDLQKTVTSTGPYDSVGDVITYQLVATNTGDVTLSNVSISDPLLGTLVCTPAQPATLAPNATLTCTGSYTITQDDLDAGQVSNTATAKGTFNNTEYTDTDSRTVPMTQSPSLIVDKELTENADEDGSGTVSLNDTLAYTIMATNNGNVTLHNVTVSDSLTGDSTSCTSVAPSATCVLTVTYVVSQTDVDEGNIQNVGTADSDETPPTEDPNDVPIPQNPALSLEKTGTFDAGGNGYADPGELITYTFVITNTGNVTLHNVTVTDPKVPTITCSDTTIPVGQSIICSGTYAVTQADIDAGSVYNLATADSDESGPDDDNNTKPLPQNPSLFLEKTGTFDAGANGYADPGELITYTFVVTNTGNVTLNNITVTDPLPGLSTITCDGDTILIGGSITCTATYAVTQDDIDAGSVYNLATADSDESNSDDDENTEELPQNPALALNKTGTFDAGANGYADPGELITYIFVVTNTGNVTLHNVTVTDPLPGLSTITCDATTLPAGGFITCTATYPVTQADIDAGFVTNLATADSDESEPGDDGNTEELPQNPALTLEKTGTFDAGANGYADPGELITYTFVVTNTGNVTLHNATVSDPLSGLSAISCDSTTIPVGGFITCTATYAVSQADIDAGFVYNLATADSHESNPDDDDNNEPLPQSPSLSLEKTGIFDAGTDGYADPGELITYTFVVTNTGNITLHGVTVTDPLPGLSTITCTTTTIPVGESITCTATYEVTQDDIDAGSVHNLATADSDESGPETDDQTVPLPQNHAFAVAKTASPASMPEPGGPVTFTVIVNNTGNTTLNLTSLQDDIYGDITDNTNADLNSTTCSVPQTILVGTFYECTFNADVTGEPGLYTDTVTAVANDVTASDDATVELTDVAPSISVDKSAVPTSLPEPGGNVTFTVVVANNSFEPVTLTSLTDDIYGDLNGKDDCVTGGTIAAGDSYMCSFVDAVTGEPGFYTDTVTAVATDNDGTTDTDEDSATVEITNVNPAVILTKSADPTILPEPGGDFEFTIVITNTSVESVTITAFDDTQTTACDYLVGTVLAVGQSVTCTYTIAHTDAGSYSNSASVTVQDNEGNSASGSDEETVTVTDVLPTVDLVKDVTPATLPEPGGVFTFSLTITNISVENVIITGLGDSNVLSPQNTPECLALVDMTLTPGQSVSCEYEVTHTDAGTHENTADVTVADNEGNSAGDSDSETVTITDVLPTVAIVKTAFPSTLAEPGGAFTFTLEITNSSVETVTVTALTDDNALSAQCLALIGTTLAAGASTSCQYTITHTDAGSYPNTASITVKDNEHNSASDSDDETVTVTDVMPTVQLIKDVIPASYPEPGGVFTFTLSITNTSVETVIITALTDDNTLSAQCLALVETSIAAGGTVSCSYTVTHTDAGIYNNIALVTVADNEGNAAFDDDSETVTVTDVLPTITVEKTANPTSVPETGGNVTFTFVVTNTSVEPLTITSLSDSDFGTLAGDADCKVSTVLPAGSSCNFAEVHFISGDFESGISHNNVFTATANDNENNPATDDDDATVEFTDATADINIVKVTVDGSYSGDGINILTGESIKWHYTVTNAGNYPLSNVTVTDSASGVTPVSISGDTNNNNKLDPTETWVYEASGAAITGNYSNTGTAYGDFTDGAGNVESDTATDGSSYFGADPQIAVTKVTVDGATSGDALNILTGETIKWRYTVTNVGNVPLSNVTATDSVSGVSPALVSGDANSDSMLDLTETWIFEASGTAATGNYSNTGTVSGQFTDSGSHTGMDTATDTSSYFGANPQVDIVKKTVGSDGTEGDNVFVLVGATVTWKYYVTNTGNVALSNVTVTDNRPGVTVTCPQTTLAVGGSMICTATGTNNTPIGTTYSNIGTANGSYTDGAGHTRTPTDSDGSGYYSGNPGMVTNSSLCDFGTSFRLIFTPDVQYYTSSLQAYKLSDSNPGQFFYNVFQTGGTGTVTLTLPYPFITQGATPIHVYRNLTVGQSNGQNCLQPTNEIRNYQTQVTLNSYPANNYAGTTTVTLTGLPTTGFMYINIHLDYGLEKLRGWVKNGSTATYNTTINPTIPRVNIVNNTQHTFTSSISNSTDSIFNTNEFKRVKGFGGLVKIKTGIVGTVDQFDGLEGATVQLWRGTTLIETMTTDVNGWYLSEYIHRGSAATYTVKVLANTGHVGPNTYTYPTQTQSVSVGGSLKFGEGNFQIIP